MAKKYTDLEALKIIQDRKSITEKYWSSYHDDFQEIYDAYKFYQRSDSAVERGEKTNMFIPYCFAQIETKIPRVIQAIFAYDPFFKTVGVGEEDRAKTEGVNHLLWHQLKNEIDTFWAILTWLKEASIYGNSFMYVPWVKQERMLKRKVPKYIGQHLVGYDYVKQNVIKKDQPDLQPIDIFDCFPAPFGSRIQDMPYFIVRSEPTAQFIKDLADKGFYDKKAAKATLKKESGAGFLDKTRHNRLVTSGLAPVFAEDPRAPRYEMYTCWEDDWMIVEVDNEILYNGETPFEEQEIPIVGAVDTPVPHELFAFGQIKPILRMNYYANDILGLNLDNFYNIVSPGLLVKRSANMNIANFENNPQGMHPVDTLDALKSVERGSEQIDTMNNIGILERMMNLTSGSGDVVRGLQASKGDQTAREVMALIGQANYRFDLSVKVFKEFSLRRLLKMLLWRNQGFMPMEKSIRIHGENGIEYPILALDDVLGNFDFDLKISPIQGDKIAWANNLIKFLDIVNIDQGQHPELVSQIGQALGVDASDQFTGNPALEAAAMIAAAQKDGLMNHKDPAVRAKQAFTVLAGVFQKLAPKDSKNAKRLGGQMKSSEPGVKTEAGEQ